MRGYCQKFQLWNPLQWAIYINNSVDKKKLPVSCYTPPLIQDHCFLRSLPLLTIILISIIMITIIIRVNRIREMVSFELGKELEKDVYMGKRKNWSIRARNPKIWGLIPHGDSEFFLSPTLTTRQKTSFPSDKSNILHLAEVTALGFFKKNNFLSQCFSPNKNLNCYMHSSKGRI